MMNNRNFKSPMKIPITRNIRSPDSTKNFEDKEEDEDVFAGAEEAKKEHPVDEDVEAEKARIKDDLMNVLGLAAKHSDVQERESSTIASRRSVSEDLSTNPMDSSANNREECHDESMSDNQALEILSKMAQDGFSSPEKALRLLSTMSPNVQNCLLAAGAGDIKMISPTNSDDGNFEINTTEDYDWSADRHNYDEANRILAEEEEETLQLTTSTTANKLERTVETDECGWGSLDVKILMKIFDFLPYSDVNFCSMVAPNWAKAAASYWWNLKVFRMRKICYEIPAPPHMQRAAKTGSVIFTSSPKPVSLNFDSSSGSVATSVVYRKEKETEGSSPIIAETLEGNGREQSTNMEEARNGGVEPDDDKERMVSAIAECAFSIYLKRALSDSVWAPVVGRDQQTPEAPVRRPKILDLRLEYLRETMGVPRVFGHGQGRWMEKSVPLMDFVIHTMCEESMFGEAELIFLNMESNIYCEKLVDYIVRNSGPQTRFRLFMSKEMGKRHRLDPERKKIDLMYRLFGEKIDSVIEVEE